MSSAILDALRHATLNDTPIGESYPGTSLDDTVLLRNGSRSVSGDLPVDIGVTVDGVDISEFSELPFVMVGISPLAANARRLAVGPGLTLDDGDSGGDLTIDLNDLAAGAGLYMSGKVINVGVGAGILVGADSVGVDTAYAFEWLAQHVFDEGLTIAAGASLRFGADASMTRKSAGVVGLGANTSMEGFLYAAQVAGWRMADTGWAYLNQLIARGQLRSSLWSIGEQHALSGMLHVGVAGTLLEQVTTL